MCTDYLQSLLHAHCIVFLLIFSLLSFHSYDQVSNTFESKYPFQGLAYLDFDRYHLICTLLHHKENASLIAQLFLLFLIGSLIAQTHILQGCVI